MKNLIIVESPAKAKTIKNFLGDNYDVIASKGHIRDLPQKKFGIKIKDKSFEPEYEISADHDQIVKQIKTLAKKADQIYLATDEDREGEAIAYHIAASIGKQAQELPRIVFHEITKSAISNALSSPRKLNIASINAQQARRLLDRIVGYKLSPLLNLKIQRGLSAGRVQSAALKIVVDREREILNFKPVEFHSIDAVFKKDLEAELVEFRGKKMEKLSVKNAAQASEIVLTLQKDKFSIENIESKSRKTNPYPPFMTSTLQQAASTALGFNPRKTMSLAQSRLHGVNDLPREECGNDGRLCLASALSDERLEIVAVEGIADRAVSDAVIARRIVDGVGMGEPALCFLHACEVEVALLCGCDNACDILLGLCRHRIERTPGSGGLVTLPYWNAVQSPYWEPVARGAIVGWRGTHGKGSMYRSLLEAICIEMSRSLHAMEEATGVKLTAVRGMGGGLRSPLWRQIMTDAIGLPITGCKEEEISALGAAIVAMASTGVFGDTSIATAAERMAQFTDVTEPNMDEHEVYAELGEIQGRLYSNLKETNDLLHEFAKRHPDAELSGAEE